MPRQCSVCARADRELVDAALAGGSSFRDIRRRFGLALGTVHRHRRHVRRASLAIVEEAPDKAPGRVAEIKAPDGESERLFAKPELSQPPEPFCECARSADEPAEAAISDLEREQQERDQAQALRELELAAIEALEGKNH